MNNFKHSILAASLAIGLTAPSFACGWYEDPSLYNLFHCVKEIPYLQEQRLDESTNFWVNYLGGPDAVGCDIASSVRYMQLYHFDDDNDSNDLITALRQNKDTEALGFLKLNTRLAAMLNTNSWDYQAPSVQDLQNLLNEIDHLKTSGQLSRRKTFLKMRCLYALKDYQACQRLWDTFASKWEPSPLRDRVEGYMAGIQFQKGNYQKAIPLYLEQGDGESIRLCVNRMLESVSIEQEYDNDPNSLILGYILEDYANYFYHASCDQNWSVGDDGYKIWSKVVSERDNVLKLAERVVKEGKAKDLQMWQAFIGFVQMTSGDNDAAYQSFCKAEELRGNGVVSPLIRDYKFCASLGMKKQPKNMDNYILDEVEYYLEPNGTKSAEEQSVLYCLYDDMLYNRIDSYLTAKGDPVFKFLTQYAIRNWNFAELDGPNYTTQQVIDLRNVVIGRGRGNALHARAIGMSEISNDRLNELVGTRLMRDDKYDEAIPYLRLVNLDFIANQGITPFLMQRPMENVAPFRRFFWDDGSDFDPSTVRNTKLIFCQQVQAYKEQAAQASSAEGRAEAYYELAKLLFHGSASGDWWAISQYGHSSYRDDYNELCAQTINYLHKALEETNSSLLKGLCYYGLAATPDSDAYYYFTGEPMVHTYSSSRYDAYQLVKQLPKSHPVFGYCDWLDYYVALEQQIEY